MMEFQAWGLCFTSPVRNYCGLHYLTLNWDITAQKSFPRSVASWFQLFCPSALLFCLLDLRGASCPLGVMSRSLLPPPWVVQMIQTGHPWSPEDDSSKQSHPGHWAHPNLFKPRPFWCWCLNLEVLVCWMTVHPGCGVQKISLNTEVWEDSRAREGEKVHALNQELQWIVEKLLLSSLKLVPKQPLTKPKRPQHPSHQLWCCFCQAPMENKAGKTTLIVRRFLDFQIEIAKYCLNKAPAWPTSGKIWVHPKAFSLCSGGGTNFQGL